MNEYQSMRLRHQQEVNAFPIKCAFSKADFARAMCELGLDPAADTDKVVSISGGCFIRKAEKQAFLDMLQRHHNEMEEAIASDITGEGFAYWMFRYELANQEYAYTLDITDTLKALGYTEDDLTANPILRKALGNARKDYLQEAEEKGWG